MNFYIKQKLFSWGDKFSIYDENGEEVFFVEGKPISLGKKLWIYDKGGRELAYIEQKLLSLLPRFRIYRNGRQVAEVTKDFTFFHQRYTVSGVDIEVIGDFFAHNYSLMSGTEYVASVGKEWFTLGDAFRVSVSHDDPILILAIVLIIDACIDAEENAN